MQTLAAETHFVSVIVTADATYAARCDERISVRRRVEGQLSDSLVGLSASSSYRFSAPRVRPYRVPPKKMHRYPRPQVAADEMIEIKTLLAAVHESALCMDRPCVASWI